MLPGQEQPTTETEVPSTETTETTESSSQPSERTEIQFEEPDFSAISNFADSEDEEDDSSTVDATSTEEVDDEVKPEETPATPPKVEGNEGQSPTPEVKAEEPKKEETPQPEVKAEETPAQPEIKMPTREELEGMYTKHREETLPTLEKLYQLTQEEAEAFNEKPEEVLPKLAARLHYDAMLSNYNAVMAALPSVVQQVMEASRVANEAETAFFGEWPELKDPKYATAVKSAVRAYRSSKPDATREDVIKGAGTLAMVQLGLERKPQQQAPQTPTAPRTLPPKPAAPSGSAPTPPSRTPQEEDNVFAELGGLWRDEMAG